VTPRKVIRGWLSEEGTRESFKAMWNKHTRTLGAYRGGKYEVEFASSVCRNTALELPKQNQGDQRLRQASRE